MKVSYQWLKELVDLEGISYEQLVKDLSLYIVEVDAIDKLTKGTNIVTAKVLECVPHPDSDHLHVTKVDTGTEVLQVVCGAPNVAAGQIVMLALPGAKLPGGTIKQSVIRGVESNGMICSLAEVELDNKYIPEAYKNGIYVLPEDTPLGLDALEYLGLNDDIIELGLTPNRMDLLSMNGVANDLAAFYHRDRFYEFGEVVESKKEASSELKVEVKTDKCLLYNARVIKNVKIAESPTFIKSRLMASGIRPINNVVDITNYILMLFGQPLHAFDQDVLGGKIVVRDAKDGEEVVTLDDIKRTLNSQDIVITDGSAVTCIGGVMGCANTEVTDNTKNIVLEAAIFDPLSVRKTSSKLGLRSESSTRFERGVDLNQTVEALNYATFLLEKYAGGEALAGVLSVGITHIDDKTIELSPSDVEAYLGIKIEEEKIVDILTSLGFEVESGKQLTVKVPNRRLDISIKADLIEEIARLYGYQNLASTLPKQSQLGELTLPQKRIKLIRHTLAGLGLNEVNTYALVSSEENNLFTTLKPKNAKPISLLHPMSEEHAELRMGLIPSLIEVAKYNTARKLTDLALFELGSRYYTDGTETDIDVSHEEVVLAGLFSGKFDNLSWGEKKNVDFYSVKGILENLEKHLGITLKYQKMDSVDPLLHPGRSAVIKFQNEVIGYLASLHPAYAKSNDLEDTYIFEIVLTKILNQKATTIKFAPMSNKPVVVRDLAFVMERSVPVGELMEAIAKVDRNLISKVEVFDIYESVLLGSKRSVAFTVYFESDEALTDEIINAKINKIIEIAQTKYQAMLRM